MAWTAVTLATGCAGGEPTADPSTAALGQGSADLTAVAAEIEALVWTFHAADTARNAEAVVGLLWPDYSMLVDGQRLSYEQVASGSRDFMAGLTSFHTVWSDLEVLPLSSTLAVASFTFRDSITTVAGDLIQSRGPTTLVWERRGDEWRMRYGDADHYPISSGPSGDPEGGPRP